MVSPEDPEELLSGAGKLPREAELAVEKLLNVVEALCCHSQNLSELMKSLVMKEFCT